MQRWQPLITPYQTLNKKEESKSTEEEEVNVHFGEEEAIKLCTTARGNNHLNINHNNKVDSQLRDDINNGQVIHIPWMVTDHMTLQVSIADDIVAEDIHEDIQYRCKTTKIQPPLLEITLEGILSRVEWYNNHLKSLTVNCLTKIILHHIINKQIHCRNCNKCLCTLIHQL